MSQQRMREARKVFMQMKSKNIIPTPKIYDMLINGSTHAKDSVEFLFYVEQLTADEIKIDQQLYHTILYGYGRNNMV
jgi:pentatricopeptide repeat protein